MISEELEHLGHAAQNDGPVVEPGEFFELIRSAQRLELLTEFARTGQQGILIADRHEQRNAQNPGIRSHLHVEQGGREQGDAGPDIRIFFRQVPGAPAALGVSHQIDASVVDVEFLAYHRQNVHDVFLAVRRNLGRIGLCRAADQIMNLN